MTTTRRLPAMPFVLAIAVAVAVVLSAPFVGQIRSWLRATFPGQFVLIVGLIGGTLLAAALMAAALRIRDRRAKRYATILAALGIAATYSWLSANWFTANPNPESVAVERFHFLEYGVITFLFYRAWRPLRDLSVVILPALAGLIVGTAEEWLQWFIPNRVGEIADIFLNLVAIGCGLLFSSAVLPPDGFRSALESGSVSRVSRMAAATVLALAIFVHAIHLGYTIVDADAGSFTSRYFHSELTELQQQKAAQWRTNPPPLVLKRLSREDQYLTEGIQHVAHRNKRWAANDIAGAWQENLILEKYFVPVLDTPTYAGTSGHRWPPEQRADAEARARPPLPAYVSEAYPYRILTWNKWLFWTISGGLAVALLASARRAGRASLPESRVHNAAEN